MIITTERLILRPWRESDAETLYHYAKDPEIGHLCGWNPHQSVEESLNIIRTVFNAPETYAVCLGETYKAIGTIALEAGESATLPLAFREAELGYWLGRPYWRQGYASEAAAALIRRAFTELAYDALWCVCHEENDRSKGVMEKCGFSYVRREEVPIFSQDAEGWIFTGQTRWRYIACLTKLQWQKRQRKEKV